MKEWAPERLAALSRQQLHNLYVNAHRLEAHDLVAQIERSGLPYWDGSGLKLDSHLGRQMRKIVSSPEALTAAAIATKQGRPALAGVEPLIVQECKEDYSKTYEATIQAGYLVAQMMEKEGYVKTGQRGSIHGGVAKTAEIYRLRD
jgi:hypothetical protein